MMKWKAIIHSYSGGPTQICPFNQMRDVHVHPNEHTSNPESLGPVR